MNDERSFPGEGEVEGDSVDASGAEAEVALVSAPRRTRPGMDGGGVDPDKPGPPSGAAVGESDDDERPIVALFKVKRPRLSKKAGPSAADATTLEDPRVEEDAPGGDMDFTLASLRKKLKNPKRVKVSISGSGGFRAKDSSYLDKATDVKDPLKLQREESGLSPTKNSAGEGITGPLEYDEHSSGDGFDDSLSAFFQKAHRTSARKSVPKRKKQVEEAGGSGGMMEGTDNVFSGSPKTAPCGKASDAVTSDVTPAANKGMKAFHPKKRARKPRHGSALTPTESGSMVTAWVKPISDDETLKERPSIDVESALSSLGRRQGSHRAVTNSRSAPGRMKRNSQKPSPGTDNEGTVEAMMSDADRVGQSSEENVESSVPQTLNSASLVNMKGKPTVLKNNRLQAVGLHDIGSKQPGTTSKGVSSGPVQETHCSPVIQTIVEERHCVDGLKQCSYGKLGDPVSGTVELSSSYFSRKTEETHGFENHGDSEGPLHEGSKGAQLTSMAISQPCHNSSNEPYGGGLHGKVMDLCSTHVKKSLGESLTSSGEFNHSLECLACKQVGMPLHDRQLNGSFMEAQKEIGVQEDCVKELQIGTSGKQCLLVERNSISGRHSCEKTGQDELQVLSSGDLKVSLSSFSDQEKPPIVTNDRLNQKFVKPSEDHSTSPSSTTEREMIWSCNADVAVADGFLEPSIMDKSFKEDVAVADGFLEPSIMDKSFKEGECLLPSIANEQELPATGVFFEQSPERFSEAHEQSGVSSRRLPSVLVHNNLAVVETKSTSCDVVTSIPEEFPVADVAALPNAELNNIAKQKAPPRATRKPKRHKHGDMTYEGDVDWEVLMHDAQGPFGNTTVVDEERFTRITYNFDSAAHVDSQDWQQ